LAERALHYARCLTLSEREQPQSITIERCPPEHAGLGTGTQLALAVARALGIDNDCDLVAAAQRMGRGLRSALGIHGFQQGGFLVDGGQRDGRATIAPLLVRTAFPAAWRIVLVMPPWTRGLAGGIERQAFADLLGQQTTLARTDALCRLVLLGMMPALVEQDLPAFGEALYDFNRRVGEMFAPVQGGPYAQPRLAEVVAYIRAQGVPGVGQSSWGPTIFGVLADDDRASHLAQAIRARFNLAAGEVICTAACNRGASSSMG
jgi:beta-ribofuranosylaminobenzene 5'-phosphate synthase